MKPGSTGGAITFPTWAIFLAELEKAFEPVDQVGNAMHRIEILRQGTRSAEETNTEWDLVGQAGIEGAGDTTLIKMYQKILN